MNRWTYYSPLLFGSAAAVALWDPRGSAALFGETGARFALIPVALAWGLTLQLGFLGLQGAFAQVLPVPGGRSMRGTIPVVAGWLILASVAILAAGAMVDSLESRNVKRVMLAAFIGTAAAAAITYAWGWPTAERDFADRD